MPTDDLIRDAGFFVAVGLMLALVNAWLRPAWRRRTAYLVMVVLAGLGSLVLLGWFGAMIPDATAIAVLRELALLVVAIGMTRISVMFAFETVLGKIAAPQILSQVLMALVLIAFAVSRMSAVGVNLAGIVTTSAVVTGVIAFSLQETLGNLWSGIQLQLENTCRMGDWVRIDNVMGRVVGIRWRCVAIATNSGETVIVPNTQLSKGRVTVLSRRGDEHIPWRRDVDFEVAFEVSPARVIEALDAALIRAEIANVAAEPRFEVLCTGFAENGMRYAVRYWLTDLVQDISTDSAVRLHISATLARHRMEIPYPHRVLVEGKAPGIRDEVELAARRNALAKLELFQPLTDAERGALAAELADQPYVAGDAIARQGEPADSLFILARGRIAVFDDSAGGTGVRDRLATLEAPACFGEMGLLTGQARGATVVAENEVLCYRLEKGGFDSILKARPELVEALSQVMASRQAANDAKLQSLSAEARAHQTVGRSAELVRRIKGFFGMA